MSDPIDSALRQFVMLKLANLDERFRILDDGTIILSDTQAWMTLYDQLMRSPDITKHWSVVWIKSADDWQDEKGQQCLAANFAAVRRGMKLRRLLIIADQLWPKADHLPHESILRWVQDQNRQGINLDLARESEVNQESDLVAEMSVYGDRAIESKEFDNKLQTMRLVLSFDSDKIQAAMARWNRLKSYAVSYWTLLDQLEIKE